jgi:hypothetical protein
MPNFSLFTVNLLGIKDALSSHYRPPIDDLAVEAGAVSSVAGGAADLLDLQQEGIAVAIQVNFFNDLQMARGFTLEPEPLAGARPKAGFTRLLGLGPAFRVHVGNHQDFARLPILDDGRDQSLPSFKIDGNVTHKNSLEFAPEFTESPESKYNEKQTNNKQSSSFLLPADWFIPPFPQTAVYKILMNRARLRCSNSPSDKTDCGSASRSDRRASAEIAGNRPHRPSDNSSGGSASGCAFGGAEAGPRLYVLLGQTVAFLNITTSSFFSHHLQVGVGIKDRSVSTGCEEEERAEYKKWFHPMFPADCPPNHLISSCNFFSVYHHGLFEPSFIL